LVLNLPGVSERPVRELPESLAAEIENLYQGSIREIASYASLIALAESEGFFETRLICDGILLHKSSMATWLSDRMSPTGQACAGEDAAAAAHKRISGIA
jgi:ferritin-like metal-binding protein YciE